MSLLRKLRRRLRALLGRTGLDQELDAELQFHLAMDVEKHVRAGVDPAEARRLARLAFGAVEVHREAARDARGIAALDEFWRDLRHGVRALSKRPGYLAVVLLTLGLGVGGSAAIYGAVDGILLTPLPYPEADRIVGVWQTDRSKGVDRVEPSPANFFDIRDRSRSFVHVTAMEPFGFDWLSDEGPIYLPTWLVYEHFFETFGTRPLLGRFPRLDEHQPGGAAVVVLGYAAWQRWFGGDSAVVGRVFTMDEVPRTVIGVMPSGFSIPSDEVIWAPKVPDGWERQARSSTFYTLFARLRDGVEEATAAAELRVLADRLAREYPRENGGMGLELVPLPIQIVGEARGAMLLLLGAVGLVLLVVVANVGSLQLARAVGRGREFAVRGALGAGRSRLLRQLLTENLVLATLGTLVGFLVAQLALAGIRSLAPVGFPRIAELKADADVLLFAAAVSAVAVVAAGVLPARVASRVRLQSSLAAGGRGQAGSGARIGRAQSGLVVLQLGLSLVLLIGAGLLTRSFLRLLDEDRGFRSAGAVTFTVQSWSFYPEPDRRIQFVAALSERLRAMPGVEAAGVLSAVPLAASIGSEHANLAVEGLATAEADGTQPLINFVVAGPGGLEALGVPLVAGRTIGDGDRADGRAVALVNRAFAVRYFGAGPVLGRRIAVGRPAPNGALPPWREIVGVVADIRRSTLAEAALPTVYVPHAQSPTGANAFVIRGAGPSSALLERAKQMLWEVNPSIPVYHEASLDELVGASVRDRSFLLAILAGFATMALGLAAAGIFGLMSYRIGDRTREIGVRMAFGAGRHQVLGMVLRQGTTLAAVGIGLGVVGAVVVTRVLASRLYRVAALDPVTFIGAALLLLATAVAATWYPAWRAASIDPVRALSGD